MLKICFVFWKSEPQCACKHYAYKKTCNQTKRERETDRHKSVKWIWHSEDKVDSTGVTYNIKEHFYEQI